MMEKATIHEELQKINQIEEDFLHKLHNLLQQLQNISNTNKIVTYERKEQVYEIHGKEPEI